MKTILSIVICSTVVGLGFGAALAYIQVRPVAPPPKIEFKQETKPPVSSADETAPKAEVLETVYEFGTIELGASRSHDFKVTNVGGSPLEIEVGSTTCKCTVGSLPTNELQPGESTNVQMEWVAKPKTGPFRHGATIITNDPSQSQIELTVEGTIVTSTMLLNPSELIYGTLQTGETKEAAIDLLSYVEQELEIVGHEIQDEKLQSQIEVQFEPIEQDQLPESDVVSGIKISTSYRAGKSIGPVRGLLTLLTNLKNAEQLVVPISSNVVGDISIYGPGWRAKEGLLRMGNIPRAEGKSVRLNLAVRGQNANATEFEVASVDPPALKVTVGERRQMSDKLVHVKMQIEVPAGTEPIVRLGPPASTDAEIVLRTNHPDTPEVRM
ncbi:MAG: DUF1573 domain-containing protein, partial [Bythopirellula sp.]